MRSTVVLLLALSASSVVQAQMGGPFGPAGQTYGSFLTDQIPKAAACNMLVNKTLNELSATGYGLANANGPVAISQDGKTIVLENDRVVSRTPNGDVETIVFKANQATYDKDGKPTNEVIRKTIHIKRKDGQVVGITGDYDLKKQAEYRAHSEKQTGKKIDSKMFKSMETTFKPKSTGGCETDQKAYMIVRDETGKEAETFVTYDAAFCERLKPTISRVGSNNASQCGELLSAAESVFNDRTQTLKAEGKVLATGGLMGGNSKDTAKFNSTAVMMSTAIAVCIQEQQQNLGIGSYPVYGSGGIGYSGAMGGLFAPTEPSKAKPSGKKVNPAVQ